MISPASIDRIHAALLVGGVATHEAPVDGAFVFKSFLGGDVAVEGVEPCEAQHSGLILPTLQAPAYITTDADGVHFHKALVADNNITGFARVTLTPGNRASVSVSDRPAHLGEIVAGIAAGSDLVADAVGEGEALFKCLWVGVVGGLSGATTSTTTAVVDWELASALLGWGGEFFKADHGAIPAGARWITVHPNGNGSKGVPVLVQPAQDGTFRVIGGAGGKLNMLKLRGVKSQEEYRQEHAQRAAEKRNQRREQVRRDKELGLHDAKVAAREHINEQRKTAQRDFIQQVADAMGWSDDEMALDTKGLSEEAKKKAEQQHHARLLAKAKEAVATQRQMLVASQDARAAAGLNEVPLNAGMDQLSVDDIDPVRVSESSGVSPAFKARSEAAGLTQEKLDSEVGRIREREVESTGRAGRDQDAAVDRGDVAELVRKELEAVPKPDLKARVVDAQRAVKLIKAQKAMQALEKAAREANRAVDASTVEPRAYVLESTDTVEDKDVLRDLADDVRTKVASSFLAGVKDAGGEDAVEAHAMAGAYNAINALSQTVGGGSMLDRSVVDVLGIAGAAQVLARRLHRDLRDVDEVAAGLEEFHVTESPKRQQEAIDSARELQDAAAEIEQGEAAHASDLAAASELNRQRKEHLAEARKVLGQALGEGEAHAAMIAALRAGPRESLDVSLGKTALDSAVKQLWALGLKEGDYTIDRVAGNTFATIHASGMDKLAAPVDKENMERVSRNLAIMRGDHDEDDWMPQGFARRPDLDLKPPPGVAATLAAPMDWGHPDREQALKDYIGGRMADGDSPADIFRDANSQHFFERSGDADAYGAALDAVVPRKDGRTIKRVEELAPLFNRYADDYVQRRWGGQRSALNKQSFEPDAVAQDALHRALSDEPTGVAAYKAIGDLTREDRKALRAYFDKHVAKSSEDVGALQDAVETLKRNEPERYMPDTTPEWIEWSGKMSSLTSRIGQAQTEVEREGLKRERASLAQAEPGDVFSQMGENPSWNDWRGRMNDAEDKLKAANLNWQSYGRMLGGKVKAFEVVQDLVRSRIASSFVKSYNTLRPHAPLKLGRTVIRNDRGHIAATDPEELEKQLKRDRELIDSLRTRNSDGSYASGGVADKIAGQREERAAYEQTQMGFFASDVPDPKTETPLNAAERHTVGHAAEQMISRMMGVVGRNFEPGKPVKLFNPSMSADRTTKETYEKTKDNAKRQRMIKLIAANKRVIAGAGVGSGKTGMGLGAFAHLYTTGKVKKGLFVVPSIVQGQFGAEALRFLKAGQFNWHCEPGGSYEDRLAAYKNPDSHFAVVTHQSFRDDLLRMASAKEGAEPEEINTKLAAMSKEDRAKYVKGVLDHHGIAWDYVMADEAHGLLNRAGKENSGMSNIIEGATDNAEYYMHASGDPVKNDPSEAFSLLQKMDGARYNDRDAFMRRYGGDTQAAKEGLQRELARHLYAMSVKPDVKVTRTEATVKQSPEQQAALDTLENSAASLRIARMTGKVDVAAAKAFAPAMFEGVPDEQHEEVAKKVAEDAAILKQTAIKRILNNHPSAAKLDHVAAMAKERNGKQGVVFAHNLEAVDRIKARLEAEGHRVVTISGKDSSADKAAKIQAFNPDKGDATADIIVCSDAGATGANLQSGKWLCQYDCPDTAMTHAQRQGRINRIGQKNPVELIDLIADHELDRRARKRLATKYNLRELLTSPLEGIDDTGLAHYLHRRAVGDDSAQGDLF